MEKGRFSLFVLPLLLLCLQVQGQHRIEVLTEFTPSTPSFQLGGSYEYVLSRKWALSLSAKRRLSALGQPSGTQPFGFRRFTIEAPETNTFTLDIPLQVHRSILSTSGFKVRIGAGPEIRWEKGRVPFGTRTWVAQTAQALGFIASFDAVHRIGGPISFRYGIRLSQGLYTHYPQGDNFVGRPTELDNGTQFAFQFGVRWSKSKKTK